jgi:pyrroline-5-carboxylate reductase
MLAIKPQVLPQLAGELAMHGRDDQVLISIMAGIGTNKLGDVIGKPVRAVRVMPNTPMMVGLGMSGLAVGEHAKPGDEALALKLFGAAGKVVRVEEKLIDAVTAVSGSGPAYVYYLAEAMEKAAGELGLGEHARLFVSQTLLGAARRDHRRCDRAHGIPPPHRHRRRRRQSGRGARPRTGQVTIPR